LKVSGKKLIPIEMGPYLLKNLITSLEISVKLMLMRVSFLQLMCRNSHAFPYIFTLNSVVPPNDLLLLIVTHSKERNELQRTMNELCDALRHANFTVQEMFQGFDRNDSGLKSVLPYVWADPHICLVLPRPRICLSDIDMIYTSGEISVAEFCSMVRVILGPHIDKKMIYSALDAVDSDLSKGIDELLNWYLGVPHCRITICSSYSYSEYINEISALFIRNQLPGAEHIYVSNMAKAVEISGC
jgi:hypothetical protein